MEYSKDSFVSVNEILADVLKTVDDSGFKINSEGFYVSQIQQALEELSFDTFFDKRHAVLDMTEDGRVDMPSGSFNIKKIKVFNGTECNSANSANVYYKKDYNRVGMGSVARDTWNNNNDPFYRSRSIHDAKSRYEQNYGRNGSGDRSILYYNTVNGEIVFSPACLKYPKVYIEYNGVGCEIGEEPLIPKFLRQAVKDYTSLRGIEVRITKAVGAELNRWQYMYSIIDKKFSPDYTGTWAKAEYRVKTLDSDKRNAMKEYFAKINA